MGKYIIEKNDKETILRVYVNNEGKADFTQAYLVPYTAPDLEKVRQKAYEKAYADAVYNCSEGCSHVEQVRKESYQKGYDDAVEKIGSDEQAIADKAYKKGLSDAWEAARKIVLDKGGITLSKLQQIFHKGLPSEIIEAFSASEAIEEIRAYEQAQKELEQEQNEEKPICAEDVMRQYLDTFCKRNFCTKCLLHTPDFTCGRGYHFLSKNPVSDEEVRRAYAKVVKE